MSKARYPTVCLMLVLFIMSCATAPRSGVPGVDRQGKGSSASASDLPPEFFEHDPHADIHVEIESDVHTRPSVPARVTYFTAAPAAKNAAIDRIRDFLIEGEDPGPLFGKLTICGPFITEVLSRNRAFNALDYKPIIVNVDKDVLYERGFTNEESLRAFAHYLRNTLSSDGKVLIRRPTAEELDWYWTIISWDIEEPVFVLESPSHRIFLDFHEGTVFFADDFIHLSY